MTHTENNSEALEGSQEAFKQLVQERLRQAVRVALITVLEEEVAAFIGAQPYERNQQRRELAERYAYAFADGTYFTVIYNGEGCKMPILAVVGIAPTGERDVLAFRVGDRENHQAWEDLFDDLKQRGVKEIGLWVSDGNKAMLKAISAKFATAPRQRCVAHKMNNVLSYIPNKQQ